MEEEEEEEEAPDEVEQAKNRSLINTATCATVSMLTLYLHYISHNKCERC